VILYFRRFVLKKLILFILMGLFFTTVFGELGNPIQVIGVNHFKDYVKTDREFFISGAIRIDDGKTVEVPSNLTLKINPNGLIIVPNGTTLKINGKIDAGFHQIFKLEGSGNVEGDVQAKYIFPEWFGNISFGTPEKNKIAIQKAIDLAIPGKTVYFQDKTNYTINDSLIIGGGDITLKSQNAGATDEVITSIKMAKNDKPWEIKSGESIIKLNKDTARLHIEGIRFYGGKHAIEVDKDARSNIKDSKGNITDKTRNIYLEKLTTYRCIFQEQADYRV